MSFDVVKLKQINTIFYFDLFSTATQGLLKLYVQLQINAGLKCHHNVSIDNALRSLGNQRNTETFWSLNLQLKGFSQLMNVLELKLFSQLQPCHEINAQ